MLNEEMTLDLIKGLREIFAQNVLQIILYGSVARREETAESDIDIAIIIDGIQVSSVRDKFIEWNSEMDMKYNSNVINLTYSEGEWLGNASQNIMWLNAKSNIPY